MKNLNLKIASLALFTASAFASNAFAGATNTVVKCKNAAGKAVLEADVPGDFAEFTVKAKLKDEQGRTVSAELYNRINQRTGDTEENGRLTIFQDLKNGVYAFQADSLKNDGVESISLYALPKTLKAKINGGMTASKFKGKLSIRNAQTWSDADVVCTTDYSL